MIELRSVSFAYSRGDALPAGSPPARCSVTGIDLRVRTGEVVVLTGESGCGKTTLTRLTNGLAPHYYPGILSGSVLVGGKPVAEMPLHETALLVGSVFQNPCSQFFNVDTTSELAFACENQGLPEHEIRARMTRTAAEFGIESLLGRNLFRLSGGEKQRIACASVSCGEPEVFVLDEPSSNLDAPAIERLRTVIEGWKARGKTILLAEHRLSYLRGLVDRLILMRNGRIEEEYGAESLERTSDAELRERGLRSFSTAARPMRIGPGVRTEGRAPGIAVSGLRFAYRGGRRALDIDRLEIPARSIVAITGDNGAGKTTFARCLCGLERGERGTILMGGEPAKRPSRLKASYLVMQDVNHQLFTESVLDEVILSFGKDVPEAEKKERAERILDKLDLLPFKDNHPMSLSGGEKQRTAIAGAIASERELIVFDEPTSGLDLRHMREVAENLRFLRDLGKIVLVVTHDRELMEECCDGILRLEEGRVAEYGRLERTETADRETNPRANDEEEIAWERRD